MKRSVRLALSSLIGAFSVACAEEDAPDVIQRRIALTSFGSCDELETHIEDVAIREMTSTLDFYKDGNGWFWRGGPVRVAEDGAAGAGKEAAGPTAYTKTTVQESGVDEADFVKTDGVFIYVLSGQSLYIVDSWPAAEMQLVSELELSGYPTEMFLTDAGRIVVFLQDYAERAMGMPCSAYDGCVARATTRIAIIDASDRSAPRIEREFHLPGWYRAGRRIESSIRVVLADQLWMPAEVKWWPEFNGSVARDDSEWASAIELLEASNAAIIRAQTLDDWLPLGKIVTPGGGTLVVERDCTEFSRSNAPVRLGVATVATIDLETSTVAVERTSIIGEVGTIYASTESLYIATPHWWWEPRANQQTYTYLHKFDITEPKSAVYVASGGVEGLAVNQFALDEEDGFLRIATTVDRTIVDNDNPWRVETTNRVSVLSEADGALSVVGQTADVAAGERIQSARFVGDRGFVVTFRQVDPLFTIDLSVPTNPRIVGELKVPGFSSYIHPLDANHLLTIGIHIPEPDPNGNTNWEERAMKLSLFDVSDFANPKEKFTTLVGTAYGWSEAGTEHRAFNYFPERKLLAIPFADYRPSMRDDFWGEFVSELRVYGIDIATGISFVGALDMVDLYREVDDRGFTMGWSPWIRRSVMADAFAYAISDAGIRVADTADLDDPLATVVFRDAIPK